MSADNNRLEELAKHKYINLETYRKNGQPVSTPVWFMIDNGLVYVVTSADTGKAKRLRNNPAVRIMPSGFRGEPKGEWIEGKARFAEGAEAERAIQLRKKKYGLQARLAGMIRGASTVIAIELV
ncbi:putative pyridoxamine 5'-phosphate oxidase-like, FMN-binding domain protein [Candidatus Nitrososphaera gargensis Ga9.2]|uniref:Putative pyridoxamine 5'-phosphate oxidase-like, FMN-binding domain protein n=1 Tax=Nitrososphaera gargensis (strain Ga9.2) TaxID=1237085 RepID=K0IGP9_NITGG|nr:PPOX class F420-dependent oxidoreductase [Candidatus Nitrososphaera gargensis]AFU59005.1 putative pyridoxamine 5'-phosphate oxidase-like, FMN-binding domain protein [Candidatus Nitrososphaera gargensis Ga9.2]